ncbi:MAG: tRNA uridine(34) 5-carboxymethylaminomethyl modification radical SAM/GNAT enzyme Elp3, partial [Promethearchaeota archaeon]
MEHKTNNNDKIERMARDLIKFLVRHPDYPKKRITELKNKYTKKYNLGLTIKNSVIIKFANKNELPLILTKLRRRSTRSISGVTVVAVMTKPMPCPGNCIYCPGEKSQPGEKAAKSYTGREPAARRSIMYHYDPFLQTYNRLKDLAAIGHNIDKVELIIMGGTFLSTPLDYQKGFIMGCFEAIKRFGEDYDSIDDLDLDNEHNNEDPYNNDIQHYQNISNIREQYKNPEAWNKLKTELESSNVRLVGVTIETRPDFCYPEHINRILDYGGTRVEIGVQTTREDLLKSLRRGHTIDDTINSFRFAKDSGLKINAHMMPMLPGSTIEEDYNDFKTLFENPDFRPDMLKIYPTLVVEGTELYEMWSKGEYKPYDLEELINLLARIKSEIIPKYVRIQRVQRDIPAYLIKAGVKKSNLRQLVQNK